MTLRLATVSWLAVLFLGTSSTAMDRQDARLERIGDIPAQSIYAAPSLSTADTCYVNGNDVIVYRIDGWVVGFELYKSLLDPSVTCSDPYPFAITAINMPMIFDGSTSLTVSVDVETVDSTTIPGCPIPGVMLAISSEYELTVPPGGGLFNIWIPLDSPVVVNSPFFAGFYIGNAVDTSAHAAILTDSVPVPCVTYNIWDETVGWIDLVNNSYYNFPGRLAMEGRIELPHSKPIPELVG